MIRALAGDVVVETPDDGGGGTRLVFSFPLPAARRSAEGGPLDPPARQPEPSTPAETTFTAHRDGAGLLLSIRGELDLATAAALRPALLAELGAGSADGSDRVTVDLQHTTYLASAGLGLLLELAAAAERGGRSLRVLTSAGGVPARVLALAGLDALLRPISPAE
jgi:anti-anti-sigma factor